jgi:hypothetical protein
MKKIIISILVAAFAATAALPVMAADEKPAEKKAAPAVRAVPFRGKIAAVDKAAKTVKVGERTFHVTSETRIVKAGKPATLDDATVGEDVGGAYRESEDKKMNLVTLRVGAAPARVQKDAPKQDDKK